MNKKLFILPIVFILAGCTLPANLQDVTKKLEGQKAVPTPSSQLELPQASAVVELEEKSQGLLELSIQTPQDGATVASSSLTVKGTSVSGAEVAVNDFETKADAKGNFSAKLTLEEGENTIVVTVNDAEGNWAEKQLTVNYEVAEK